jgi:hypothetical protein
MPLSRIRALIRNLFDRGRADRELDDELQAYVALLAEEHERRGMPAHEARRAALLRLRGADRVKEGVRDARAGHVIEQAWQDTRFGLRMLQRNPGFAIVAILTLALGIGANTAIFSVLYAVLLRPLPYQDPSRLVQVEAAFRDRGPIRFTLSHANFWDVRDQVKAFATVGRSATTASACLDSSIRSGSEPRRSLWGSSTRSVAVQWRVACFIAVRMSVATTRMSSC